jgi:hypothetical protein
MIAAISITYLIDFCVLGEVGYFWVRGVVGTDWVAGLVTVLGSCSLVRYRRSMSWSTVGFWLVVS